MSINMLSSAFNKSFQNLIIVIMFVANVNCLSCSSDKPEGYQNTDAAYISDICSVNYNKKFPVTIRQPDGPVTIKKRPKRVVTIGADYADIPLGLGVKVVAMSDESFKLPWVRERIQKDGKEGKETPKLLPHISFSPYKEIRASKPDIIFAPKSLLHPDERVELSKIAPLIQFPDSVFADSIFITNKSEKRQMECKIRMYSKALGLSDKGESMIRTINDKVKTTLAQHKTLKTKEILPIDIYPDKNNFIILDVSLLHRSFLYKIGLPLPKILKKRIFSTDPLPNSQAYDILKDIDILIMIDNDISNLHNDPNFKKVPAVKNDRILLLNKDENYYLLINYNRPLSIPWGIDRYFDLLEKTAKK